MSERGLCLGSQVVGRQEIGIAVHNGRKVINCLLPLPQLQLHHAALIIYLYPIGCIINGLGEILQGAVVVAQLLAQHTSVVVALRIAWCQSNCLIVVREGTAVVMFAVVYDTTIDIVTCPLATMFNGFAE